MLKKITLIILLLFAFILRVWNLSSNPPELHPDELTGLVSAKSILRTGHDVNSQLLFYFYDNVELRPPIYGYSALISTLLFGESTFSIRLPAVIYGLITIFLIYKLTILFTSNEIIGLLAAAVVAILPWHIHYSRIGWEPASLLPFLLAGIFFLTKGIIHHQKKSLYLGFIFLGLTIYTYQAGFFDSLIFMLVILTLNINYAKKNFLKIISGLVIYGFLSLPFLYTALFYPLLLARAIRISTFHSGLNLESIMLFLFNYFSHWSFNFLFINGDPNLRQGAQFGELYWWMLPFILLGLFGLSKATSHKWLCGLIIFWLIIFPLGGSLTNDGVPHATRTLIGAPIFSILTAIGIYLAYIKLKAICSSKLILGSSLYLFSSIIVISFGLFAYKYYIIYPKISALWWQYGNAQIFNTVNRLAPKYQRACLGNLDYWNTKPLLNYYLKSTNINIFADLSDPQCLKTGTIFVTSNRLIINNPIQIIYSPTGQAIYYIYVLN